MKIIRKMYDWVLHWAETPYAIPALFILSFAEASFFPVPPDILLIALALSKHEKAFKFALICSIASILGGITGYAIGWGLWGVVSDFFFNNIPGFSHDGFNYVKTLYDEYNFWIVFTAGFTPIPYKIITISAGVFGINFFVFVLASVISRTARFFLVAGLIYKFGPTIRDFIDKYFNWLSIGFIVLLIGSYFIFKLL